MSILATTTTGIPRSGQRIVLSGVEKVGKTSMASKAPRAYFIPIEIGYATVTNAKSKLMESFDELMQLIEEITEQSRMGKWPYQSLVFDSATAIERLIHDAVLRSDPGYAKKNKNAITMESALGGYGKAYQFANELFSRFTAACDVLAVNAGINIVITCHVYASKVIDPAYGEYHTWDLLLHSPKNEKTYGKRELITQWADMIGFLHEPLFVIAAKEGETIRRAIDANKGRVLGMDRTPGYVAGNRFGLEGEIPISLKYSWNELASAIHASCGIDVYNRELV